MNISWSNLALKPLQKYFFLTRKFITGSFLIKNSLKDGINPCDAQENYLCRLYVTISSVIACHTGLSKCLVWILFSALEFLVLLNDLYAEVNSYERFKLRKSVTLTLYCHFNKGSFLH